MNDKTNHEIWSFAEKIQPVYEFMKWEWAGGGIPSVEAIVRTLKMLVADLLKDPDTHYIATGGLYVERDRKYTRDS